MKQKATLNHCLVGFCDFCMRKIPSQLQKLPRMLSEYPRAVAEEAIVDLFAFLIDIGHLRKGIEAQTPHHLIAIQGFGPFGQEFRWSWPFLWFVAKMKHYFTIFAAQIEIKKTY